MTSTIQGKVNSITQRVDNNGNIYYISQINITDTTGIYNGNITQKYTPGSPDISPYTAGQIISITITIE